MSVLATVEVPADAFVLGSAFRENPGIRVRLERVVPVGSTFVPYVWAADDSEEAVEAALRADDDIDSFEIVDSIDGEILVRVEWIDDLDVFVDAIHDSGGAIHEATGEVDTWRFSLRFPSRDDLATFYHECVDRDIPFDLETVHNPGVTGEMGPEFDLTDTQRETLVAALEAGYFGVPRTTDLQTLAANWASRTPRRPNASDAD